MSNFLCSKFIFTALHYRIATLRLKNSLKRILRPNKEHLVNDTSTALALMRWLEEGYDKLNIGGGRKNLAGFINIDFVPSAGVERQVVANILDLSFVPSGCASQIHTNHVLEHLTQEQLARQIQEYHRILKGNELLTIRCPNALGVSYGFWFGLVLEQKREDFVRLGFPADEDFGNPADRWVEKDFFGLLHWFYGDIGNIRNQHLNIITPSKIEATVAEVGFNILKTTDPEAANIVIVAGKGIVEPGGHW